MGARLDSDIMTIREVAEYLKLTEKTAYRHAADGKIPVFKVGGAWRFRRGEINKWIERQSAAQQKLRRKVMPGTNADVGDLSGFVWSIAEILRGDFKQSEYGKVILPFIVLRRLDCLLDVSKKDVLEAANGLSEGVDEPTRNMILFAAAGENMKVYNLSAFTFKSLKAQDPGQLHDNLIDYITNFSSNVRDIFLDKFLFTEQLKRLNEAGILWQVFNRFTQIDLHPERVGNIEMGYLFEDLIRRFSEIPNETAGEHFTPREVIRLIVELLIANDDPKFTGKGIIRHEPLATRDCASTFVGRGSRTSGCTGFARSGASFAARVS